MKGLSLFGDVFRMEYYVVSKIYIFRVCFKACGNINDVVLNESSRRLIYIRIMDLIWGYI